MFILLSKLSENIIRGLLVFTTTQRTVPINRDLNTYVAM